jgi:plastocyanin
VNARNTLSAGCAIALILVGIGIAAAAPSQVGIHIFQFRPGQLEVSAGTRVTWTNQDDITHTVTSGTPERRDGRFDEPLGGRGAAASVQFSNPGVYPYFCGRHPSMRGEIRVN